MSASTKISFAEFQRLQETADETVRYELDEGELIVAPSPTARHNIVRYRLRRGLTDFVQKNSLGCWMKLISCSPQAQFVLPISHFISKQRLHNFDLDKVPVEGSPALAVEVISPSNFAEDTLKKIRQYLAGGSQAVWLVYPLLRVVEIHDVAGIRVLTESEPIREERLFGTQVFSLSRSALFSEDLAQ